MPDDQTASADADVVFAMQSNLRNIFAVVRGEVAQLVEDGFTPEQARAIVATFFGWKAAP